MRPAAAPTIHALAPPKPEIPRRLFHRRSAILLLGCALAGCRPGNRPAGVEAEIEWDPKPAKVGPATWRASLRTPSGEPLRGATVTFEATMTHPGMVPVIREAQETAPGRYEAPGEWTMAGDWVLIVSGKTAGGEWDKSINVPGVAGR